MIKGISRNLVYPLLYGLGIPKYLFQKEKRSFVQCYHGVMPNPNFALNNRHMDVVQFEKDLLFYKKHFDVVHLSELFENTQSTSSKPRMVLTFDDGYLNNFTEVVPLITKHKIPVTFFIISASLDDDHFITWYDLVDFVKQAHLDEIEFHHLIFKKNETGAYFNNSITIEQYIKSMQEERDAALLELAKRYHEIVEQAKNNFPGYWKLVNRKQLMEHITNPYLNIGSHTHLHYNLEHQNAEMAKKELEISSKMLSEICPYPIVSIAYPDGSYNTEVKEIAAHAGYNQQLAVDYRLPDDAKDLKILSRYSVSNSTTHEANMLKLALYQSKYGF